MPRFTVDVKAFINVEVEADSEDEARQVADAFVENAMHVSEHGVAEYNRGLPEDAIGTIVPGSYTPSVDGESDVEESDQ